MEGGGAVDAVDSYDAAEGVSGSERGTGNGGGHAVFGCDEPLFGFGKLGLAFFVAVDGFPGRAGGVVVAIVNEAEVIRAVADDRAVACVERVHPLDLVAGDAGVQRGRRLAAHRRGPGKRARGWRVSAWTALLKR